MMTEKLPPRPPGTLEMMARARFAACPHFFYIKGVEVKVLWEELTPGAQRSEIAGMRAALLAIREPTAVMKDVGADELDEMKGASSARLVWRAMVDEVLK